MTNPKKQGLALEDLTYIKTVTVGSINPNLPFSDQERENQVALLNRCLNDFPRGTRPWLPTPWPNTSLLWSGLRITSDSGGNPCG